jgi:2-methylisocitrate lyase-like PEP mutase family enzyme
VLAGARCVYPASVYDPMTARLAADLGYEIGMFAGSVASLAAAVSAADETLKALREGTKSEDVAGPASELMKRRRAMPIIVARRGNSSAAEKFPA